MEIIDYINLALENKTAGSEEIQYLERSYLAYNLGTDYEDALENLRNLFTDESFSRIPESTPSRTIVNEHVPSLSMWARDNRSVSLTSGVSVVDVDGMPQEEEISQRDLRDMEDEVRETMKSEKFDYFFKQLLITGHAVVSVGLDDMFFVPRMDTVKCDLQGDMWVYIDRNVLGHVMENVAKTWERAFEGEPMMDFEFDEEVLISHGQVSVPNEKMWIEFVRYGSDIYYRMHNKPVIYRQVFDCDEDGDPMGVHAIIRNEELSVIRNFLAISSRVNEAIQASAFVEPGVLPDDASGANSLFNRSVVIKQKGAQVSNDVPVDAVTYVPSRVIEIDTYSLNIERMMQKCYRMTGLHPRPTEFSAGNTSATESVMIHKNTTIRAKKVIGDFIMIMKNLLAVRVEMEFGVQVKCDGVKNPLEYEERKTEIKEMLPMMLDIVKSDPTGKMYGGVVNAKTTFHMLSEVFESVGIPTDWLGEPGPNQLQDAIEMAKAQDREKSAEDKIAEAEIMKAQGGLQRAAVAAVNIPLSNRKHNDETVVKIMELIVKVSTEENVKDKDWLIKYLKSAIVGLGNDRNGEAELIQMLENGGVPKKPDQMPPQGEPQ